MHKSRNPFVSQVNSDGGFWIALKISDFDFENKRKYAFSCTELVNTAYENLFEEDFITKLGKKALTPDAVCESNKVKTIIELKKR